MKDTTNIPMAVRSYFEEHIFSDKTFRFSAHALAAKWRKYDEAVLPLRKPSRFNGAVLEKFRYEPNREQGAPNWTAMLRKSGFLCDYIIVVAPKLDGSWLIITYWPVHHGASDYEDYETGAEYGFTH